MIWALYRLWTLDTLVWVALWSCWCRWWWGCHRSPRRLVATLPRRWRSGRRRGSSSSFESRMNWARIWSKFVKTRKECLGPELSWGDSCQVGDVVAICKINGLKKVWSILSSCVCLNYLRGSDGIESNGFAFPPQSPLTSTGHRWLSFCPAWHCFVIFPF